MNPTELRALLGELSDHLTTACGPGVGFALFIETKGGWSYTSNCARKDVIEGLTAWLSLTGRGLSKELTRKESGEQVDDRLALERRCADIGKTIGEKFRMGLFLFEGHNSAYIANVEDIRDRVQAWLKSQKPKN